MNIEQKFEFLRQITGYLDFRFYNYEHTQNFEFSRQNTWIFEFFAFLYITNI